jgi:sulfur transfer complex TusBCD TusB component (DsrH family)
MPISRDALKDGDDLLLLSDGVIAAIAGGLSLKSCNLPP